jgi:hypothetical protein
LNQAVKRNKERFPQDFVFQLSKEEKIELVTNCDHLSRLKHSSTLPYAFTEHGAIMVANVLKSGRAPGPPQNFLLLKRITPAAGS